MVSPAVRSFLRPTAEPTRGARAVCVAFALLVGSLCSLGVMAPISSAAEPGLNSDLTWFPPEADRVREAAAMADLGSRWTRIDIGWHDFEPSPGVYNSWSIAAYRTELERARAAGQKIVVMVATAPTWATGSTNPNTPPRDPADYARFLGYLGRQHGGFVDAWELWNEPNLQRFWSTGPDPSAYAALVKASYPAIKAADPGAQVVMGSTSLNDDAFLRGTYRAGVKGSFDILSTHPYTCDAPDTIKRDADGRISKYSFAGYRELRATMLANGDDKPVWFTEFGWSTSTQGCGVSEATQADYLTRAFAFVEQDPYVQVALVYNLRNNFFDGDADTVEARYGLIRTDHSPKPSYFAFKAYATRTAVPSGDVIAPPPVWPAPVTGDTGTSAPPTSSVPAPAPPVVPSAPTVVLTSPADGSTYDRSLALRATATDDAGVARVDFLVDGRVVGSDTSAPYAMTWKVPIRTAYGAHDVAARAYDGSGLSATSTRSVTRSRSKMTLRVTTTEAVGVSSTQAATLRTFRAGGRAPRAGRVRITLLRLRGSRSQNVRVRHVSTRRGSFGIDLGRLGRGRWVVEARTTGASTVRRSITA